MTIGQGKDGTLTQGGSKQHEGTESRQGVKPRDGVLSTVAICAVVLLLGFLFKAQCLKPWADNHQYTTGCYNDVQALYGIRGLEETFPYINGHLEGTDVLVGGAIEYPVLTGVFMWIAARFSSSSNSYLVVTSILLVPFGLLAAWLLAKMTRERAILWAAAPAVVLYAFHNWDLMVVAAAVGGFYAWWKGKPETAAVLFGVGAALKMFPIFFLGPLVLALWFAKERARAVWVAAAGVGTLIAINLPFALRNFDGWFATYQFHRFRGPNYDNIWTWPPSWFPPLGTDRINLWSAGLTLIFFTAVLALGYVRARKEGAYPVLETCAALLAVFLLWNKVHSPQYALWILPFFVLLRTHIMWWVAYTAVDLAVYWGVFRFFAEQDNSFWRRMMVGGVWVRAALLLVLVGVFLRSRPAVDPPPEAVEEKLGSSRSTVVQPAPTAR